MVKSQAVPDPLVQMHLWLIGDVDVDIPLDLQYLVLMINFTIDDSISQSLRDYKLNIISREVQLSSNVTKRYVGVCDRYLSETDSDDYLIESEDH